VFLLAFHIIAVGILVVFVWAIAFGRGRRAGERQLRRRLGLDEAHAGAGARGPAAGAPSGEPGGPAH
jgi:hypothetical protein